jgi:hypothetical protein
MSAGIYNLMWDLNRNEIPLSVSQNMKA